MNRLGLTDYNSVIKDIYNSNTIGPDGEEERIPSEKKESKPGESKLVNETLRLRNTAVLNLKLKQKIFKYEKNRLSKLRVDDIVGGEGGGSSSSGVTPVIPGAEDGGGLGLPSFMPRLRPKARPKNRNRNKNRNKNKNKNRPKNRNKNRNRNRKPNSKTNKRAPRTRGRGGSKNPFRRFNPFKPKVTRGKPTVPPGLNNPFKGLGLGNPFKRFRPKPSITIGGANKIPRGLNNPFDVFKKGPNITRSLPKIPRGLQSPLGGLGLPKIKNPFKGPKVTTGGAPKPFGLGPGGGPTVTTGGGAVPKPGFGGFKLPKITPKGVITGVKGFVVGWLIQALGEAGINFAFDKIFGTPQEQAQKFADQFNGKDPAEQQKIREKLTEKLNIEKEYQKSWRHGLDKAIAMGDETMSEMKSRKFNLLLQAIDGNLPAMKDGGVTGNTPQLVIVGDGGEEEYIVPKSKLSYFLGSKESAKFLNYGVSPLVTAAENYAKAAGLKTDKISELQDTEGLEGENIKPITGIKPIQTSFDDLGKIIFDFVHDGLLQLLKPIKRILKIIKSLNPLNLLRSLNPLNLLRPRSAAAATLPPSLSMNSNGVVGGATNGKFGQIGSGGFSDRDNQDTGVDIELYGSEGKLGKTYGYNSEQGPYGGRGVEISFPYELTYNEFVPGGRNKGHRSVTSSGSTDRVYKDPRGGVPSSFGYVGSYTFTDENGRRYEIMMGHGDRPFNQFKEGEKIPPGTVLGYQGASGTSDDAAGGVYDHISFHVNSMDGGNAEKVIRQFTDALLSGRSKKATEQLRASQAQTPVKPTINKDSVVEQDPLEDEQANLPLIPLSLPQVITEYLPLPIPMIRGLFNSGATNTPAWGNNSVVGG